MRRSVDSFRINKHHKSMTDDFRSRNYRRRAVVVSYYYYHYCHYDYYVPIII